MTKTGQVAQGAKVEGGGVALIGRMWWNLVGVTGSCWCASKSEAQAQGLGPPFCRVGNVASGDQD